MRLGWASIIGGALIRFLDLFLSGKGDEEKAARLRL